jgi:hypothetical protein
MTSTVLTQGASAVEQAIFSAIANRGTGKRSSVIGFTESTNEFSLRMFGWPVMNYPTSEAEESQVLEQVASALAAQNEAGTPTAAIVIEPTASKSGHMVSNNFIA